MGLSTFRIWRGDAQGGQFEDFTTEVSEGMVVLRRRDRILQYYEVLHERLSRGNHDHR